MTGKSVIVRIGASLVAAFMLCGAASASLIGQDIVFECTNCDPPTSDTFQVFEFTAPDKQDVNLGTVIFEFLVDLDGAESSLSVFFGTASNSVRNDLTLRWSDLIWGVPGGIVALRGR